MDAARRAQLEAAYGLDAPFEKLLLAYTSQYSLEATNMLNEWKDDDPDSLLVEFCGVVSYSSVTVSRVSSLSLLAQVLCEDQGIHWGRITDATKSTVKCHLVTCLCFEIADIQRQRAAIPSVVPDSLMLKRLSSTLPRIASVLFSVYGPDAWPELLDAIRDIFVFDSDDFAPHFVFPMVLEIAAHIVGEAQLIELILTKCSTFLSRKAKMLDRNAAALINEQDLLMYSETRNAVLDLLILFNSTEITTSLIQETLPLVMQSVVSDILNAADEDLGRLGLESLCRLAKTPPDNLRQHLIDLVGSMLQVATEESLDLDTRHQAIEYMINLAIAQPALPDLIRDRLVFVLMHKLLDVQKENGVASETLSFTFAQDCLNQLADKLNKHEIFRLVLEQAKAWLNTPTWQNRYAGIVSVAGLTEYCSDVIIGDTMEKVVSMILNSLKDGDPCVKFAAFSAIKSLTTNLRPNLQNLYHETVIRLAVAALDASDSAQLKVS